MTNIIVNLYFESCYWVATILVNKFNMNHCYICKKKRYSYGNNTSLIIVYKYEIVP